MSLYNAHKQMILLSSRDIEDILNVIDGRAELYQELLSAEKNVKDYLVAECKSLLNSPDIHYLIQSSAGSDQGRAQLIFERIKTIATT